MKNPRTSPGRQALSLLSVFFCGAILSSPPLWGADNPVVKTEFIFEQAPFPHCHASTIAQSKQRLVAAWFGGTREKNEDVAIWSSRYANGKWTAPVEVANGVESPAKRYACWNPVLF